MWPQPPFRLSLEESQAYLQQKNLYEGLPPSDLPQPERQVPAFLAGLQGNVLRPHGRNYTRLLFFRHTGTGEEWRRLIRKSAGFVTTALQQFVDARQNNPDGPDAAARPPGQKAHAAPNQPFVSLALTKDGIDFAHCVQPREPQAGFSFREGMWSRRISLGDVLPRASDTAPVRPLPWEEKAFDPDEQVLHGMWLLARDRDTGPDSLDELEAEVRAFGGGKMEVVHVERGATPRKDGAAFEPFGFRDGISMPSFFASPTRAQPLVNLPLSQVLIDADGAEAGGSFLVFRKLRQKVREFREFEQTLGKKLTDKKDPARLLVGRYRDGQPLAPLRHPAGRTPDAEALNDFDFTADPDAQRCPFHAHIRKANARVQPVAAAAQRGDPILQAQIVRRSAVYGLGPQWVPDYEPPADVGLLFMAYMAGIAAQFEKMHAEWFTDSHFPDDRAGLPDTLMLGGGNRQMPWQWEGGLPGVRLKLSRFIEPLGGIYLFVPPVAWLRNPPVAP